MNIYITLDYELCMGQSGTPENCLFEPMRSLTAMLNKYGIKTSLFVDAAYLLQLKKLMKLYPQLQEDYKNITSNIVQLEKEGHSIQLHLHPQWCYSTYNGSNWELDKDHYKLSDMPLEDQKDLIRNGVRLLNSLIENKVKAFRAGGYSIENFPDLYDTMIEEGIIIDSSIFRGEKIKSKYQTYNYLRIPNKTSYKFSYNNKIENNEGKMTEYPLSTIVVNPFTYLWNKYNRKSGYETIAASKKKWGDGIGIGYPGGWWNVLKIRFQMLLGSKAICTYIEDGVNIEKVYDYAIKHYEGDEFIVIGHPKGLSPFSIELLEIFIKKHPEINYRTFK